MAFCASFEALFGNINVSVLIEINLNILGKKCIKIFPAIWGIPPGPSAKIALLKLSLGYTVLNISSDQCHSLLYIRFW